MKADEIEALAAQVRRLFHRLRAAAEQVHAGGNVTPGGRAVLESLYRGGPQTVPAMARARPVSRQHIQQLVNPLLELGLLRALPNPGNKRSPVMELTPKGRSVFERMRSREKDLLSDARLPVGAGELQEATRVLRAVSDYFEAPEWAHLLRMRR